MRRYRQFVVMVTVIFLSFASFGSIIAQEELTEIVRKVGSSTILIVTYDKEGNPTGQGSGFFISQEGEVITNRHVILNAMYAEIRTVQGEVYPITHVLAEDKEGDIARVLVDIPRGKVKPLTVSVSTPEAGERIVVIGNPFGLEGTVADGIVSAVRDVSDFDRIIQITAPISPGSSGSPVVNMKGEVVGVATFQLMEGQNLNFAIPSERIANLELNRGETLAEWQLQITEDQMFTAVGLYLKGLYSVWNEDYENGLSYFEKAVEENPSYADAYFYIGYCNGALGRYKESIGAFNRAIHINPDYDEAFYISGWAYGQLGCYEEAIQAFKQAIRLNPVYTDAYYNLGVAYNMIGCYKEAINAYNQAISINPNHAGTYNNLGWTYSQLGRYREAMEAYKQAIRINPDDAMAHYNLGVTYGKLGRYREAMEACKYAIRISPDYADAHYYLGIIYLIVGDNGAALEEYKLLKELDRDLANRLFDLIYE